MSSKVKLPIISDIEDIVPSSNPYTVYGRRYYTDKDIKKSNGGHLYGGKTEPTQKMQIGLGVTNDWKPYTLEQVLDFAAKNQQKEQALKDVLERRASDYLTTSNDATAVANGRLQNQHLNERAIKGAKAHRAWEEEHPIAAAWGNVLGAVPLAVASYPFVTGAVVPSVTALGDAAAATTAGKALTSALTPIATATTTKLAGVPALEWADAGLQSLMAAHGLNTAVKEGGVSPTTALELSPLVPPTIGIGNNLYLPHLREHIYASKAPIGYDGIIKASGRIAEGVLSGRRADIENPFWFNPKSAEALQDYAFVPSSIQGGEREQYLKDFGERALKARADIWRMYNRLPQKYNTFVESEKFPGTYTAPDDIKALHWVPQPRENIDPGDFVNSVGGNVGLPEITNLGRGIPEPGYSSKEFGVTTLTDLWDLHPFSRPGDRLISRLKRQWNSSTYKAANAIRKVVGSNYIKDGSGTYIPVPNSHTYITKLEDVDLFDTGASIGRAQSTSPTLVSKAPSKIAQRTANKILKLADKVENIKAPNFTILKPIDNKLAKFEIGRLFGGKPVLVKNEIPWTMDRKFIDTEGNIGFQSSWTQGFNSTNILPQSVIDWKRGYSPALLEKPNINPDIFKYLTR